MGVPIDFESCLVPDDCVVRNDGVTEALDRKTKEWVASHSQRFAPAQPDGTDPNGRNPFRTSEPLTTPTMNSKAANDAALRKSPLFGSMAKSGAISAGGTSHEKVVLDLIEKILQKAGR